MDLLYFFWSGARFPFYGACKCALKYAIAFVVEVSYKLQDYPPTAI